MGSVGSARTTIIAEMQQGDDYVTRKAQIDREVAKIIDSDGIVIVGDENDNLYQTLGLNTYGESTGESGKYKITEFVNGEPASHQAGDSISTLLEHFFASHKKIKRYR